MGVNRVDPTLSPTFNPTLDPTLQSSLPPLPHPPSFPCTEFLTAEDYINRALAIREKTLGAYHLRTMQCLKHLLTLCEMQERFEEGIELGLRAFEIAVAVYGEHSVSGAQVRARLGQVGWVGGRL